MTVVDLLHPWLTADGVAPLLDEHHLVVLADDADVRDAFVTSMEACLAGLPDTRISRMQGAGIESIASFCEAVETGGLLPDDPTVADVVRGLRDSSMGPKRRYIVWSEADALLERDVALFSRLVNALLGVAAEREFLSPDRLIVERYVFTGGAKLGAYAEDMNGQFWRWLDEPGLASVRGCVEYPRVLTCRIEE